MTQHSLRVLSGAFIGVNVRSARRGSATEEGSGGGVGASVEREPGLVDQFLIVCGMRDESKFCRADDSDDRR